VNNWAELRPVVAVVVVLAVLAGAYEAAVRGPFRSARPKVLPGRPINAFADSAARVAAPGPVVAALPPAPAPGPVEDEEPECQPEPLRFVEKIQPGPRRYVGTVGGEQATVEIYPSSPDSLRGRFYLWRSGLEYEFSQPRRQRPLVLVLGTARYPVSYKHGGRWLLRSRPGPALQGTWVDSAGQHPRPFLLRESYQDGVRYELRHLTLRGGPPASRNSCNVPINTYEFVHLLGPAAARPPLSRVQCPGWAGRRRQLRADYNSETSNYYLAAVKLNDFGLLSYQLDYADSPFEGTGGFGEVNVLLDLVSGQQLTITSQLRPGYALPLRRLLAKHLLATQPLHEDDYGMENPHRYGWQQLRDHGQRVLLPHLPAFGSGEDTDVGSTFVLSAQGLKIGGDRNVYLVTIPYAELRPLVRPGTPLARMLRTRGMW